MKRSVSFIGIALLSLSMLALAGEVRMHSGQLTPAAAGVIETGKDRNGNTTFEMKVKHLAKPTELSPAKQVYVVWIQARGQEPQSQGQLMVNDDLEGSLHGTNTSKGPFDVFVTAEDNPSTPSPSGPEVLRATVDKR
jgi:hypothetical protein